MLIKSSVSALCGVALLSLPMIGLAADTPWPTATPDQATAHTQQTITIPVLENDIGTRLTINQFNAVTVSLGTTSLSTNKRAINYQSAAGFTGEDSFWYSFTDNQGRTNATQVFVTVTNTKPAAWPSAGNESPEVEFNKATELSVLDNDEGVLLNITSVNTGSVKGGSVSISEDGQKLTYTPPQDFSGNDEFWYVFSDAWGRTNAAKVTPKVLSQYNNSYWPTATPDYASTISTRSILIPALDNDSGVDLKLTEVNEYTTKGGTASIRNGYIRYTPAKSFSGQDSFWYNFEDKYGRANSTQIFVDVTVNTELSSIAFCGQNYFTDGTAENTTTSSNSIDTQSVELDTTPDLATFTSPEDAFAVVGDRRYLIEKTDQDKKLIVETNDERTVLKTLSLGDDIYGVSVRDNTLYFAVNPLDQPTKPATTYSSFLYGINHSLYSHNGNTLQDLNSYWLRENSAAAKGIKMLSTQQSTLFAYVGSSKSINDADNATQRTTYTYQYIQVDSETGKAMFLGSRSNYAYKTARTSNTSASAILSFDQHLISSIHQVITGQAATQLSQLRSSPKGAGDFLDGELNTAVISNDRLLLTTSAHSNYAEWSDTYTAFPAKLFSFDSSSSTFVELASCE